MVDTIVPGGIKMLRDVLKIDQSRLRITADLVVVGALVAFSTGLSIWLDGFDWLYEFSRRHEDHEIDEFLTFGFFASIAMVVFSWRRVQDQRHEIAARKQAEERAQTLANADALTGLPNRRRMEAALEDALSKLKPHRKRAFLLFDLNRFKPINDIHGHQAGDEVLIDFAKRLSASVDRESTVFRLGGDEFAVLTGQIPDPEWAARLARRILSTMAAPYAIGDATVTIGVGIGIAIAPDDATTSSELLRRADIALYRAKRERTPSFHFFESDMDATVLRRARLEADMRAALEDGSISSHFQPIVRLEDRRIVGFEALARWNHPEFGDVSPVEFIPIAEDSGIISTLGTTLFRKACEVATTWPDDIFLSFNVSPSEVSDPAVAMRILGTLGETGLSPKRVQIELTEDALVADYDAVRRTLEALSTSGIRIALDDFGAGNSSLHHLRELRFDRLKIDHSFIAKMADSDEAAAMVRAILHMAGALNLTTTAEGIEKTTQLDLLVADGCAEAQGFHFSEALPAEALQELLGGGQARAAG